MKKNEKKDCLSRPGLSRARLALQVARVVGPKNFFAMPCPVANVRTNLLLNNCAITKATKRMIKILLMFSSSTFAPLESRGPGTDCPDIRSCAAKNQPPRWLSQKRRHWDARQRGAARPSGPVHVRGPGQREPSHSLAYSPRNLSLERGSVGSGSRWAPGLPPSPRLLSLLPFARLSRGPLRKSLNFPRGLVSPEF